MFVPFESVCVFSKLINLLEPNLCSVKRLQIEVERHRDRVHWTVGKNANEKNHLILCAGQHSFSWWNRNGNEFLQRNVDEEKRWDRITLVAEMVVNLTSRALAAEECNKCPLWTAICRWEELLYFWVFL